MHELVSQSSGTLRYTARTLTASAKPGNRLTHPPVLLPLLAQWQANVTVDSPHCLAAAAAAAAASDLIHAGASEASSGTVTPTTVCWHHEVCNSTRGLCG